MGSFLQFSLRWSPRLKETWQFWGKLWYSYLPKAKALSLWELCIEAEVLDIIMAEAHMSSSWDHFFILEWLWYGACLWSGRQRSKLQLQKTESLASQKWQIQLFWATSLFLKRLKESGEQSLLPLPFPFLCTDALVVSNFSSVWSFQLPSYITLYLMFVSMPESHLYWHHDSQGLLVSLSCLVIQSPSSKAVSVSCMLNMQRLLSAWLRSVFYELVLSEE